MNLDYSNITLDSYGRPETPTLFLQTLGGDTIGALNGVSRIVIRVKYSEPSELEFDIASKIELDGNITDNPMFNEIVGQRVIHTNVYGNYIIMNPESESDGLQDTIHVKAYSLENQWEKRILFLEEGTFNFWNPINSEDTIIGRMVELMPGWSVGYISSTLIGKYRTFDQYDDYLLDFAYNVIPEKYRCVCVFDTYEKTISAYDVDAQYDTIPIYLDFDNLIEEVNITELTDELVTAISPYGEDNLDIRNVNPIGTNWIYDLSYFISNGDIPTELAAKWNAWQAEIASFKEMYYGLNALINSRNAQLIAEQAALTDLNSVLTGYENNRSITMQAIAMEEEGSEGRTSQEEVLAEINEYIDLQNEYISEKESLIEDIQDDIEEYSEGIIDVVNGIKFTEYFSDEEQAILSSYIIEMVLTEETFVSSDFSGSGTVSAVSGTTEGTISIESSSITEITLADEYGKMMYTFRGGSFNHNGTTNIVGDIIRGTIEVTSSNNDYILTAYLGTVTVGTTTRSAATVTMMGRLSSMTNDIHTVILDDLVETRWGSEISFTTSSGTTIYVSTSVSEFEKYSVQLELYDYAKDVLADLATPSYEFTVNSGNFIFAKEFESFRTNMKLGRGIHLNLGHGEIITPYLIEIAIDFEDHSSLDLVFSNKYKRHDQVNTLKNMIEQSYSSSRSFDASKYTYNRTADKQSEVDKFMGGALNAAKNTILAASDQSVVIDGAGIRVNGNITDGSTNKDIELRIVNGMIAMSDNNWNDAKLAIGYFKTDTGSYYGVNADVIAGKLLVGNNLVIENSTNNGTMQFKVDASGAWLYNSQLLLQSDSGSGMLIHPDYGFAVGGDISHPLYTTNGTTVTPSYIDEHGFIIDTDSDGLPDNVNFFIDIDGNVHMKGTVAATTGSIGGWTIASNKLYSGSGSTYVALNTSTSDATNYAMWAGGENAASAPFSVTRGGTVKIEGGHFNGEISVGNQNSASYFHVSSTGAVTATSGTFSGSLSGASVTGATGTFSGTVSGGSININDKFIVDSSGNVTLTGNITWSSDNNPATSYQVYVLYATSALSTPTGAYSSYGNSGASVWHKVYDSSNDYFASYSYDSGATWSSAIKIRGTDGASGSSAGVTRASIVSAMLNAEQQDGLYSYTVGGNSYLGLNATAIQTGIISDTNNNGNSWNLDTGALTLGNGSINIGSGNFVVDSSGNVTMSGGISLAGNITWTSANNPVTKSNVLATLDTSSSTSDGIYVSNGSIKVNASAIATGTMEASHIKLAGNMNVYTANGSNTIGGYIGYAAGHDGVGPTNGIRMSSPDQNFYIITTDSGCRMTGSGANALDIYITANGPVMRNNSQKYVSVYNEDNSAYDGPVFANKTTKLSVHHGTFVPIAGTVTLGSSTYKWDAVYASSGSIVTSDRNQKKDISYNVDRYLKLLDSLKPASYKLVSGTSGRRHIGMIAQDVEDAIEELGIDSKDFAAFIKGETDDGGIMYGLRYEEFIPLLIAKIQKQQQQINYLLSQT